jgi:hypothetical protein
MNEQFERDKVCYEQHSESFRNLNNQMWQVPIIAMTLTGGLWFGVFSSNDIEKPIAAALLFFCGLCNVMFICILFRVRLVMSLLIEKLSLFNSGYAINPSQSNKGNYILRKENLVITLFSIMLGVSASISFVIFIVYMVNIFSCH